MKCCCALFRISTLTCGSNAVFLTADTADLCLQRDTLLLADRYQFLGLLNVLFQRKGRTVEHDGCKACLDACLSAFVGAVIQMQCNRNSDTQRLVHSLNHSGYGLEACHVLACALRYTKDDRCLQFLALQQDGLGPLQVVDVELSDCIAAFYCLLQHFCS